MAWRRTRRQSGSGGRGEDTLVSGLRHGIAAQDNRRARRNSGQVAHRARHSLYPGDHGAVHRRAAGGRIRAGRRPRWPRYRATPATAPTSTVSSPPTCLAWRGPRPPRRQRPLPLARHWPRRACPWSCTVSSWPKPPRNRQPSWRARDVRRSCITSATGVPGNATLDSVYLDHILLRRGRSLERLTFPKSDERFAIPSPEPESARSGSISSTGTGTTRLVPRFPPCHLSHQAAMPRRLRPRRWRKDTGRG